MRFLKIAALAVFLSAGNAQAGLIVFNDWSVDLDAARGTAPGTLGVWTVDFLTYNAGAHVQVDDGDADTLPSPGEKAVVEGLGVVTSGRNGGAAVATSAGKIPGFGFDMSFDFSLPIEFTALGGTTASFQHLAKGASAGAIGTPTGQLNIYIDDPADAVLDLDDGGNTVSGLTNGTLIATFDVLAGLGGTFNFGTEDGSDDANFIASFLKPGVWFHAGVDLSTQTDLTIGLTDSNFDANPNASGTPFPLGPPAGWLAEGGAGNNSFIGGAGAGSAVDFYSSEDGSLDIGQVPEPTSLAAWAVLSVVGAAGARRRRRQALSQASVVD